MRQTQLISIIETNHVFAEGLKRILGRACFKVVDVWSRVIDALAAPPTEGLAAILISLSDQDELSIDDVRRLRAHYPDARIVLMAESLDVARGLDAMQAEIDGFVLHTIRSDASLVKSLELVVLGERVFLAPSLDMIDVGPRKLTVQRGAASFSVNNFTARETEVLNLLTKGRPNKVIGRDLGISEATVKVHVKAILRKTGAQNRTEVALWARELGVGRTPDGFEAN